VTKKTPAIKPGWEAFLLSHIKAPAQGGKAGSGKPPACNLTNRWLRIKQMADALATAGK
jgi:hypothetical protein